MSEIRRPRRYYLLKRLAAHSFQDYGLESAWRAKQEEQPGTPFPADFPSKALLEAGGYYAAEDVDGADCRELRDHAGMNELQAQAAIAAAAALI